MNKTQARCSAPISKPHQTGRRWTILLYAVAVFFFWAALFLYMPTLPTYIESKSKSLALAGVILAQYGLWQAIARLPLGIAADWLGWHKPFILVGIALAGLGALMLGLAQSTTGLLAGRAITGLAAATWVPLVVVFSNEFDPREAVHASAILTFVASAGRALATSLTGWLNNLGSYVLAFYMAAGVAALAALTVLPAREQRRAPERPSIAETGHLILRQDVLTPSLLAAVGQYVNWAASFGFFPILAQQLGATDFTQSALVTLHIGVGTLANLGTSALVRYIRASHLVTFSFVLLSAGLGIAALAPSLAFLFVAQFCIGLAQGISYPVLMGLSIRNVADEKRTTAMGVFQSVYAIGMFAGPSLSGLLAEAMGLQPMFGVTAFGCLALSLLGIRRLGRHPGSLSHS